MRFLALLLFLSPSLLWGQTTAIVQETAHSIWAKDVTDTSYTYCRLEGYNTDPFARGKDGAGRIKTTGSSTTVAEVNTGRNPFTELAVGDLLVINYANIVYRRAITAKASAASITVDSAIDLSNGATFSWYQQKCGTTANDGWFGVSGYNVGNFIVVWTTKNATSLDYSLECKIGDISTFFEDAGRVSLTATGVVMDVRTQLVFDACRIGLKLTTDTGAQNITAAFVRMRQ